LPNVGGSNPSTDFPKIAPEAYPIILHLTKPILLYRDVIPQIHQKRLHILDTSLDVSLNIFNLTMGY